MLLSVDLDQERLLSATANTKLHLQSGRVDHRGDHHIDHHGDHHSHHGNHHVDHRGDHHVDHHVDYHVLDGAIEQPCFWPKFPPAKSSIMKRGIMTTLIPMFSATA